MGRSGGPDSVLKSAVDAGAVATSAVADERGWGTGWTIDPFGIYWVVGKPPRLSSPGGHAV